MTEKKQDGRESRRAKRREERWEEKDEKYRDEKWRRDPVASITWAVILIWVGLVLLANNPNLMTGFTWWNPWAIGFAGAGVIVLIQAIVRLSMPEYRRGILGSLVVGLIFLGIGLGWLIGWGIFWPLILIALGLLLLWRAFVRRR